MMVELEIPRYSQNLRRDEGMQVQCARDPQFLREAHNFSCFDPDLCAALWSIISTVSPLKCSITM